VPGIALDERFSMTDTPAYRVLARKYRPATFAELIGQEAMVRTLTNAIATGRIAHAFILTGVRGVGKTTTARILARALNCIGPDGTGGPTISPCGICDPCRAIAEDRHVDVMEMDAASRTGVDDIRELTEGVRYKPIAARYKIYIIDEVHMLSKAAFNALLKTLEEPPADVKFIFATTEFHRVPVTVLSRCQRFSLRRVPVDLLEKHYEWVLVQEKVSAEPAAVRLIARAADGSVRDGLSLLDQAIALSGGTPIAATAMRDMLGVADRSLVLDLLEAALRGDAAGALRQLGTLYESGADPVLVVQDLMDLVHLMMRLKLTPVAGEGDPAFDAERLRALPLAETLSVPALTRAWQLLLKGLAETQSAPAPIQAAEMVLVRLAYVADLPAPADLVKALTSEGGAGKPTPVRAGPPSGVPTAPVSATRVTVAESSGAAPRMALAVAPEASSAAVPAPTAIPLPRNFTEVVALFDQKREALLRSHLLANVHLVRFDIGRIELRPTEHAPRDLANRLGRLLSEWTGERWVVSVSQSEGEPSLREQAAAHDEMLRHEATAHPLVNAVLETFPGARIEAVRELAREAAAVEPATADDAGEPEDIL
jgi:DNA polymerase III subunit gamma/tau